MPTGTNYKRVTVRPSQVAGTALPSTDRDVIREGAEPTLVAGGGLRCGWSYTRAESTMTMDVLYFLASADRITRTTLAFRVSGPAKVLAESWGTGGTQMRREWHFDTGPVYASAGVGDFEPVPHSAWTKAVVHGLRSTTFKRRAVAWFEPPWATAVGVVGAPINPAVLSVKGPEVPYGLIGSNPYYGPYWIMLGGTKPGTYQFGIEAWASAFAFTPAGMLGNLPAVVLLTADADFPACTALRVRARAGDGRPLCY